jgi:hypothetical protein
MMRPRMKSSFDVHNSKSIRARRTASLCSNRPRNTARTVRRLNGSVSFRRFGKFAPRSFDYVLEFNIHGLGHSQHGFQRGISFAVFDVGDHLRREAGFLGDEVFGQLAPLALLLKQRNGFDTQGLGVSIHPPLLQKKTVDSTFHYGEIVRYEFAERESQDFDC